MSRPHDNDELLSTYLLGTVRSPGVVTFSGHDRNEAWDVKAAKGEAGASSALNGTPIGSFTASHYLADDGGDDGPSDFDRWDAFQRLIESTTNGPVPIALPIYHPDLARNRYTEVVSGGVGGMVHDGLGGATVKVKYIEYRPPRPKAVAKAKAKPGPTEHGTEVGTGTRTPSKPDPNAAAKAQLAVLLERARTP